MAKQEKRGSDPLASRYPGSREVQGAGDWTEWNRPGMEVVGVFKGLETFRNGFKGTVQTDDGPVIFSTPALLKNLLDGIEIGTKVAIVYTGEGRNTGKGNALKEFRVFVMDDSKE
jgi:hypothetical protein